MQNGLILVIDDDVAVRTATARLLRRAGYDSVCFDSGDAFLSADVPAGARCVLLDLRMPGSDGLSVLRVLKQRSAAMPTIVITGHGDIPLAVEAMRLGAFDFLEKPYSPDGLFQSIERAIAEAPAAGADEPMIDVEAEAVVRGLWWRQRQVLAGILSGHANKIIAYELGLSVRTVEAYRAQLLTRLGVRGTAEAVKFALAAGLTPSAFKMSIVPPGRATD